MVDIDALTHEIKRMYDHLGIEGVLNLPSSSISTEFHRVDHSRDRGVIPSITEDTLTLVVHATGFDEAVEVVSSFLAGKQLEGSRHFGVRHASLMYALPVLHLILSYLTIVIVGLTIGLQQGAIAGVGAMVTLPVLLYWVAASMKLRRREYGEALEATGHYENPDKIDGTLRWLKVREHGRWYWTKRALFYELYYVVPTLLLLYLGSLQ